MTRRPGLTLTEALVALFIAAIGMISLMTLFPLAALQMGQAIKDERTSQAAMQADAMMRLAWRSLVTESSTQPSTEPFFAALDNPNATPNTYPRNTPNPDKMALLTSGSRLPSFPVVVDPIGEQARSGRNHDQFWVGGLRWDNSIETNNVPLPARRNLSAILSAPSPPRASIRFASLLDDLTYDESGAAGTSGAVERQGRYNWLAVVQRMDNSRRTTANLTIVVFDGRAPGYAPAGSEWLFSGTQIPTATNQGDLSLTIDYAGGDRPPITKGRWIMDASIYSGTENSNPRFIHTAHFHRVVSVTDNPNNPTQIDLELQTPIRFPHLSITTPLPANSVDRRFILLNGAAEVFERPQLTARSSP